ncbi:MAG: hypothetical protein GXO43_09970 [Crenarchaeota archaeon]|nr:hypothetical protein [Thermoproteota archaeon]
MPISVRATYMAYQKATKKREIKTYSTTKFIELIITLLPALSNEDLAILYYNTRSRKIKKAIIEILEERSHILRS